MNRAGSRCSRRRQDGSSAGVSAVSIDSQSASHSCPAGCADDQRFGRAALNGGPALIPYREITATSRRMNAVQLVTSWSQLIVK